MIPKMLLVFLFGFFSCVCIFYIFGGLGVEGPIGIGFAVFENGGESPSDWIGEEDIIVLSDRIILRVDNATLSSYVDSGSMEPAFGSGANGIRIVPESEDDVGVGDIVSYRFAGMLVVHRVVEKGEDVNGTYFVVRGDNNLIEDFRIRFEDIEYVTIALIF